MAMAEPVFGLQDFKRLLEAADAYPYYGVLLYTPVNGLDARLHEYISSRWELLNRLTGEACLLFAIEDHDRGQPIEAFRPEEVYDVAELLGVPRAALPALAFLTDPSNRADVLVVRFAHLFSESEVSNERLTTFFRLVADVASACAHDGGDRLSCLAEGLHVRPPAPGNPLELTNAPSTTGAEAVSRVQRFLDKLFF